MEYRIWNLSISFSDSSSEANPPKENTATQPVWRSNTLPLRFMIMSIYEEVEIEDMIYDEDELIYTYPCPCGDKFQITLEALWDGDDIAKCPSCTLRVQVIFDEEDLPPLPDFESEDEEESIVEKLAEVEINA